MLLDMDIPLHPRRQCDRRHAVRGVDLDADIVLNRRAYQPQRGIHVAMRLLTRDPLQEGVHWALMRHYLEQGRRRSALEQYRACREVLRKELGIEPEPE